LRLGFQVTGSLVKLRFMVNDMRRRLPHPSSASIRTASP
jgi:hypothetical protein